MRTSFCQTFFFAYDTPKLPLLKQRGVVYRQKKGTQHPLLKRNDQMNRFAVTVRRRMLTEMSNVLYVQRRSVKQIWRARCMCQKAKAYVHDYRCRVLFLFFAQVFFFVVRLVVYFSPNAHFSCGTIPSHTILKSSLFKKGKKIKNHHGISYTCRPKRSRFFFGMLATCDIRPTHTHFCTAFMCTVSVHRRSL